MIENLVKVYSICENSKQILTKLVAILRRLNFPERYIRSKINHDCQIFIESCGKMKTLSSFMNIAKNIIKNIPGNLSDSEKSKM